MSFAMSFLRCVVALYCCVTTPQRSAVASPLFCVFAVGPKEKLFLIMNPIKWKRRLCPRNSPYVFFCCTGCNWHRTANEYHAFSTWFWTPQWWNFSSFFFNFWKKKVLIFYFYLCKIVILTKPNDIFRKKKHYFQNKKNKIKKSSTQMKSLF